MSNQTMGSKEQLIEILEHIKDRVIVTGSYAFGTQTELSDIDFYIKELPEDEVDCENGIDTYCRELISYFEQLGFAWSSVFISSFAIDNTYIPLEFSAYYDIDIENLFEIDILGVKLQAAKSTYTSEKYLNGQKRSQSL